MSESIPPLVRRTTFAAVSGVALVAAVVSYIHTMELAERAGEGWRSYLEPFAVDGLVVAASMTMVVRKRRGEPVGWLPWVSLWAGVLASLAANVTSAEPTLIGRCVAAWPPLALLAAYELLMSQVHQQGDDEPVPEPAADMTAVTELVVLAPAPHEPAGKPSGKRRGTVSAADAEVRRLAEVEYRKSVTEGKPLTGEELGLKFDRSGRWGRMRIADVRRELVTGTNC